MDKKIFLLIFFILRFILKVETAPKSFSCMSYMEDDRTLMEEDDDDSQENGSDDRTTEATDNDKQVSTAPGAHLRICPLDYTFCFALWRETKNGSHIQKQGCWKESNEDNATCSSPFCASSTPTSRNSSLYYCCCSGSACNGDVMVYQRLSPSRPIYSTNTEAYKEHHNINWSTLSLWLIVVSVCLIIMSFASFIYYRSAREKSQPEEAPLAPTGPGYSSNLRNVDNLNLVSMLGSGKYGTVMKGLLHDQEVAVKIFPEAHQQYFINERNIYSLPLMDSPALPTYYGYDERQTLEGKMEYQLVLSLAPLGNLQDWLIANTMNFETFCGMVKSITRGLSHLHTELKRVDMYKPCVAHRDLNTRNILVKADRTCCISDFGFALKVFGSRYEYKGEIGEAETKGINEVGTLRYMAPELLEGAVNLRDCETSLKQMDVYALGLVLWEVATRCTDFYPVAQITPPYRAPYELEVGSHPSFDQIQSLVVRHKARPLFPHGWGYNCAAKLIKDTCEDCWDNDAEARLTSLCAEERMHEVANTGLRLTRNSSATTPLLNTNNLCKASEESVGHNQTEEYSVQNDNVETSTLLNPPPNQKIVPLTITDNTAERSPNAFTVEKNHLIQPQMELQPYQGRNPCMERNLARMHAPAPQRLIQCSKKHSFQTQNGEEHSLSCLENDVSVEELITGRNCDKTFTHSGPEITSSMGRGFPKQLNTDKKLKGWHGVRALIHKRLFRKPDDSGVEVFRQVNGGEDKLILVDNRQVVDKFKVLDQNVPTNPVIISFIDKQPPRHFNDKSIALECNGTCNGTNKRPNNLDLSTLGPSNNGPKLSNTPQSVTSNQISTIAEEENDIINDESLSHRLKSLDQRESTPSRVILRSKCTTLKPIETSNNNIGETELNLTTMHNKQATNSTKYADEKHQFRRQRSLEVFREVFNARGSNERLRDPSQRVKTPGDVPPSVRRVRSSKTLSLYDDRMMDSTTLNIL